MQKSKRLRWLYSHFEEFLSVTCMGVVVITLAIQVATRWLSGQGVAWSEELSRYAFIWTIFAAVPMLAKHAAHVRVSAQFLLFPLKYRFVFRLICDLLWVIANIFIAWWSWSVIRTGLIYPELSPTLGITRAYVEMIIPFSFIAMSWRIIEDYFIRWKRGTLLNLVIEEIEYSQEQE